MMRSFRRIVMTNKKTLDLFQKISKIWAPPPKLTVSQWADQYRKLSTEASAEPGQWHTDRAPYQREIMDAINDPETEEVVIKSSSQIGKTEIELNIIGYYIHLDPCPIMVILPNVKPMAEDWSRDRLTPMIRDTEILAERMSGTKSNKGNSVLHKKFPGGQIVIAGANSAASLASRPMRILLCDEVDRFPASAGNEGDPIGLAEKRQITYWNRKKIYVSTPTIEGASRIQNEYEKGTQEKWCIKCPHCGEYVFINFYGIKFQHEWVSDKVAKVWDLKFQCPECNHYFDERTWKSQPGKWIAENPEVRGTRSFHLNAFVSPWYSWNAIIKEWLEAKDEPTKLKVVKNTLFGETWKEKLDVDSVDKFLERREKYKAELPEGVLLLTCGVDTQDDRLEYDIVGWGKNKESWGIEYGFILGKPDDPMTWQRLDDKLSKIYRFTDNRGFGIACTCIDSGGHFTTEVYKYCKKNEHRRIVAVKGQGGPGIELIYKLSRNNKENALLVILGVDEGKTNIVSSLKVKEPGPRYCHYPDDEKRGYGREYFQGLLSEHMVLRKRNGIARYTWEKISEHARNEAFDTRNYAYAALELIKPDFDLLEKRLKELPPGNESNPFIMQKRPQKRYGLIKKGINS